MNDLTIVLEQLKKSCGQAGEESCRLFHGRGHCYPGWRFLNIDWYAPVVLVTVYEECDREILGEIVNFLVQELGQSLEAIVLQERFRHGSPFELLTGEMPEQVLARENGLLFQLDLSSSQNIGFFLDMKNGREWITPYAKDSKVLNLFSYTCSFSVYASHAGANSIVNIDMSKRSLETGRENHRLNNLPTGNVEFLGHNIFRSWKKLHKLGRYDVVVIDPPSRQKGSFDAEKDYKSVLKQMPKLLNDNAQLLVCLNSPYLGQFFLEKLVEEYLPRARKVGRLPTLESFPEKNPDANLKVIHYQYHA